MKKFLCFFMILFIACVAYSANLTVVNTESRSLSTCPSNLFTVFMHDSVASSNDTFAAGVIRVWGPYATTASINEPMFKSFTYWISSVTGTTPAFAVDYCLTQTSAWRDTAGALLRTTWVSMDSITTTTNGFQFHVELTSTPARFIWFREHNYDSDAAQIPLPSGVTFEKATKYFK